MAVEHLVFLLQTLQALQGVLLMRRVNDFARTDSNAVDIEYWKGMNIGRKDKDQRGVRRLRIWHVPVIGRQKINVSHQ